jgi:hypothetical protein
VAGDGGDTRHAKSGDLNLAYQVVGEGLPDVVLVLGFVSNVELNWETPPLSLMCRRISSFGWLIVFDKRGIGLSDRTERLPTLEAQAIASSCRAKVRLDSGSPGARPTTRLRILEHAEEPDQGVPHDHTRRVRRCESRQHEEHDDDQVAHHRASPLREGTRLCAGSLWRF